MKICRNYMLLFVKAFQRATSAQKDQNQLEDNRSSS